MKKRVYLDDYVLLSIDEVLDDPSNENLHPESQIVLLRASIRLYGQQEPILIDRNNMCIAGHGIKQAMKLEGKTDIECKYSNLKGAHRAGYRIAANQLARLSHFDPELLRDNVLAISQQMKVKFDPAFLGFEPGELKQILGENSVDLEGLEFPEYDETAADKVHLIECPKCHHQFAQ